MFDYQDAIIQNRPIEEILAQPYYVRLRFRCVHDMINWAKMERAKQAKAMGVIDIGQL